MHVMPENDAEEGQFRLSVPEKRNKKKNDQTVDPLSSHISSLCSSFLFLLLSLTRDEGKEEEDRGGGSIARS